MKPLTKAGARARAGSEKPEETLGRVRDRVKACQELGIEQVPVSYVADLLDPDGRWKREEKAIQDKRPEVPAGKLDPLTGCLPAGPHGAG